MASSILANPLAKLPILLLPFALINLLPGLSHLHFTSVLRSGFDLADEPYVNRTFSYVLGNALRDFKGV